MSEPSHPPKSSDRAKPAQRSAIPTLGTVRDHDRPNRLLITAGPTHEPIDAVRFIGNRSSGKLGVALADRAAEEGWQVCLLLGPTAVTPADSRVAVRRFRTFDDLQALLDEEFPRCNVLVMAAAVADYRPKTHQIDSKLKRQATGLSLDLEATPDLLAGVAQRRRADQLLVGFALEPRERLLQSARDKLERKSLDLIVANPLETMDAESIEATLFTRNAREPRTVQLTSKAEFAGLLLSVIRDLAASRAPSLG
ncbi:MAG: phosphopantothenoylcysteine decarboxylase [Phycisphaeraceae bacterium]|nr:phosphopantothenoylcysteine decarboxylase [Phycisphaeraceae bacterium]